MKLPQFTALVDQIITENSRTTGREFTRIILKIPGFIDQFTGEKKGNDQFYECFISEIQRQNMPVIKRGDKVNVNGTLFGKMIASADGKIFYQTTINLNTITVI